MFYKAHPPTIDYYDLFYFETRMRDLIQEATEAIRTSTKDDKEISIRLQHRYE